jgi:hypothetical protein
MSQRQCQRRAKSINDGLEGQSGGEARDKHGAAESEEPRRETRERADQHGRDEGSPRV